MFDARCFAGGRKVQDGLFVNAGEFFFRGLGRLAHSQCANGNIVALDMVAIACRVEDIDNMFIRRSCAGKIATQQQVDDGITLKQDVERLSANSAGCTEEDDAGGGYCHPAIIAALCSFGIRRAAALWLFGAD
jgi:hypothetical protein